VLLLLMELLSGFVLLVGTSLFEATSWGYALFWLLVLVALGGAAFGPLVSQVRWGPRRRRTVVVMGGALTAGAPSFFIANGVVTFLVSFILLAIAFWRGLAVTADAPSHDEVQQRFAYGFGILFFGILWVIARGIVGERQIWEMLAEAGIAFIVVSMLALVTARVAQVREPGAGGAIALAVLVQLGALLLLSFLGLQLFALDLAGLVGHAIQPFFDALGRDLFGLLGHIADPIDRFVQLIRPHGKSAARLSPPTQPANDFHGKRPKYHPPVHSPLVAIVALLVVAAMAAGIGYAIWRAVPRTRSRPATKRAYVEERRSLVSMSSLWHTLIASIRALFRKGTHAAGDALSATRRRVWGPAHPADPVRRTYAQVLRRTKALGLGMPSASTPLEFQARLADRWPEGAQEFDLLTAAYVRRRYGDVSPGPDEVASLRAGWQRLRHVMKARSIVAAGLESGRASLAATMTSPEHERPERPYPRDERASQWTEDERVPWRPTGVTLVVLSFALPVLVIIGFLVILAIASGRLS
jgi:Domain of unknown function (DUF4129)